MTIDETHAAETHAPDASVTRGRVRSFFHRHFVKPLLLSRNPPWFDARGIAMGLFVGLGLPIGTHTLILGLVRIFWRYNVIVAFAFTFVNNPITLIPMYYGFYVLGSEITGSHAAMSVVEFKALMAPIIEAGHFVETVRRFVALGADILLKWTVGALLFSTPVAVVSYVVGFRYLKGRCERRAASMGITYDELIARMEADLRSGNGGKPSASAAEEKNPR